MITLWGEAVELMVVHSFMRICCYMKYVWRNQPSRQIAAGVLRLQGQATLSLQRGASEFTVWVQALHTKQILILCLSIIAATFFCLFVLTEINE